MAFCVAASALGSCATSIFCAAERFCLLASGYTFACCFQGVGMAEWGGLGGMMHLV